MLVLTAHQTCYLPYLGFFHKVALADQYIHFDQVQYSDNDWINRNKIKTNQGELWLTVPVLTTGHRIKTIAQMEINNKVQWQKKHWKSIYLAYKKARYFNEYAEFFESVYQRDWQYLIELNKYMFNWFIQTLGIKTIIGEATDYKFEGVKNELVLDMCKKLKADIYIFGGQGKNYADVQTFQNNNIGLYFQEYNHPEYSQIHGGFIPYMSIIDLLFNEGPKSLEIIISNNIKSIGGVR